MLFGVKGKLWGLVSLVSFVSVVVTTEASAWDERNEIVGGPRTELIGVENFEEMRSEMVAMDAEFPSIGEVNAGLDGVNVAIDKIINMGKKLWNIVTDNKPVVNLKLDTGNAVPAGIPNWMVLSGWQTPKAFVYRTTYVNGFGVNVVDFAYRVTYTYGGSLNGQGQYLTQATIVPANLDVAWGYEFNAEASIPMVTNAGTTTSPVAGMQMEMHWTVETPLKRSESRDAYYIRGDGAFLNMTNGT